MLPMWLSISSAIISKAVRSKNDDQQHYLHWELAASQASLVVPATCFILVLLACNHRHPTLVLVGSCCHTVLHFIVFHTDEKECTQPSNSRSVLLLQVMVVIATIHDTSIILRHIGRRNLLHLVAILEPSFGRFRLLYRIGCMRKWTFMQKVPRGQWAFSALDAPSRNQDHMASRPWAISRQEFVHPCPSFCQVGIVGI